MRKPNNKAWGGALAAVLLAAGVLWASAASAGAPAAQDDTASVGLGERATIDVLANDTDPDSDSLELVSDFITSTQNIVVECDRETGECFYQAPTESIAYVDTFEYEVWDGTGSDVGQVTVQVGTAVEDHARNVSLKAKVPGRGSRMTLKGKLATADGFDLCSSDQLVKLQKKKGRKFKTIETLTTNDIGKYSVKLNKADGRFRALAPASQAGGETCLKATSDTVKTKG